MAARLVTSGRPPKVVDFTNLGDVDTQRLAQELCRCGVGDPATGPIPGAKMQR